MDPTPELKLKQRPNGKTVSDRVCVIRSGKVYDVSDFLENHPGGREILEKHAGQDVSDIMRSTSTHKHSQAAYTILEKYCIGSVHDGNIQNNNYVPQSGQNYKQTSEYYANDLVDWNKPILCQVASLKDRYYDWVHQPVDRCIRLFQSDTFEMFSKSPWWMVPLYWIPVMVWMLQRSSHNLKGEQSVVYGIEVSSFLPLLFFMVGLLLWTFLEYIIHRWLFHMRPPPNSPALIILHFSLHGQHHKSPMDRMRLVFPPVPATIIATLIFGLYTLLLPLGIAQAIMSGTIFGYMMYDLTHYYIHHGMPVGSYFRRLKRYHVRHHYEHQQLGFGISSKLWDYPFGTLIPDED